MPHTPGVYYNGYMSTDTTKGFEYKNKGDETPFETFLRYTDEKENSSKMLAGIVSQTSRASILDIGTGNGEYLEMVLSKTQNSANSYLTLLEPSLDLVTQLKTRFLHRREVKIINLELNDFSTDEKFDIVLASHLFYHIPKSEWKHQLSKMLSFIKPDGKLIVVLRKKDDAYDFKMALRPTLFDKDFQALTIEGVLANLPKEGLNISQYTSESELVFPVEKNLADTISIIEFYLNRQWLSIPKTIQEDVLSFIRNKSATFKQLDGIAVIEKIA